MEHEKNIQIMEECNDGWKVVENKMEKSIDGNGDLRFLNTASAKSWLKLNAANDRKYMIVQVRGEVTAHHQTSIELKDAE